MCPIVLDLRMHWAIVNWCAVCVYSSCFCALCFKLTANLMDVQFRYVFTSLRHIGQKLQQTNTENYVNSVVRCLSRQIKRHRPTEHTFQWKWANTTFVSFSFLLVRQNCKTIITLSRWTMQRHIFILHVNQARVFDTKSFHLLQTSSDFSYTFAVPVYTFVGAYTDHPKNTIRFTFAMRPAE